MAILSATVERSDLMVILIVTMASKLFRFMFVVLNSIVTIVSVCPYPAIPNHGCGRIIGSSGLREVRTLLEDDIFQFGCKGSWTPSNRGCVMKKYFSTLVFQCSKGVLQPVNSLFSSLSSFRPMCGNEMRNRFF